MLESRKSRLARRDEEAGLLFRWRVPGGSLGRTLTATALAGVLFAVAASLFRVSGGPVPPQTRETVRLFVIPAGEEAGHPLLDWARRNAPFPDRWEVNVDGALRAHLAFFDEELRAAAHYRPLLRPMPEAEREAPLPGLFDHRRPRLPELPRAAATAGPPRQAAARVFLTAEGALQDRGGDHSWPLDGLLAQLAPDAAPADPGDLLGRQRRFLVMIDAAGEVVLCGLIDKDESVLDEVLAERIRRHRFAPAPGGGMAAGPVQAVVRAVDEPSQEDVAP